MQTATLSTIFSRYNTVKTMVHDGATCVDEARLDRALGVAQLSEPRPYRTTRFSCDCPDMKFRKPVGGCKHMIAMKLRG